MFAPEFGSEDVRAMNILTGGYPAEYGRKLGGVIEVVTTSQTRRGLGGAVSGSLGSFGAGSADALTEYGADRWSASVASTAVTDRYLDPPVEENFTNHGSTTNGSLHVERDLSKLGPYCTHHPLRSVRLPGAERTRAAGAGQRQDRDATEAGAQFSYQKIFSPKLLGDVRGMARVFPPVSGLTRLPRR